MLHTVPASAAAVRARVFVAEDDPAIAKLLVSQLSDLGYEVLGDAPSGYEALKAVAAARPDVVLLDINLAGAVDGIETASAVRQRFDIPVVFVTGLSDADILAQFNGAEPYACVFKPFRPYELGAAIEIALLRHRRERQQREKQEVIAMTLRAIGDAVVAVDEKARVFLLNAAGERLTQIREADVRGRRVSDVLHFEDEKTGQQIENALMLSLRQARIVRPRAAVLVAAGRRHPVEDSAAPLIDGQGRVFGAVMVIREVAEIRALQKQIAVSDRLFSLGTLAGGIAHEINTPAQFIGDSVAFVESAVEDLFTLVPLYRQALSEQTEAGSTALADRIAEAESEADLAFLQEQLPKAMARMRDGIGRISTIVRAVKALGHPGGGESQPTDLAELLRNTITVAKGEYRDLADVETALEDIGPWPGHPAELGQAFLNIIVNAAQAIGEMPAGSPRGLIRVVLDQRENYAHIEISDTGCGISPAIADRIFDPFFTTKPIGKGTGQGLSIARAIVVDKHGGDITFTSEPGRGSTFTMRLPKESDEPGQLEADGEP